MCQRRFHVCGAYVRREKLFGGAGEDFERLRRLAGQLGGAVAAAGLTAGAADGGHVRTIAAHHLAALAAGVARLVGSEFVRASLSMGCFASLARYLALLACVHRGESTVALRLRKIGRRRHRTAPCYALL